MTLSFTKMSGAGNDFVIFDARKQIVSLTATQITKISDRKNIGCDQLIVIKNSPAADCLMEIYNSDGSLSGACGNATRCIASILFSEKNSEEITIQTAAGILPCRKKGELISVAMGVPQILPVVALHGFDFTRVDVGNPHAVTFIDQVLSDDKFFTVGPQVENNLTIFPAKTNVEFARILSDNLIEVRVWERGVGETLACGSGACAVAIAAINQNLTKAKKIITRFKGGDLEIEWNGLGSVVIMTGSFSKIFSGEIDDKFFN